MQKIGDIALALCVVSLMAGCTVHPRGEFAERAAAVDAGYPYAHPMEERHLPPLAADATPDELVTYALLSNAELEQRYWEWRGAIEQVPQEGTQKTGLMLSFNSMMTNGSTALAGNSIVAGNDPMNNIVLPSKLKSAATVALENARAAGWRFDKARWELRRKVLTAYADYALTAELIRLDQSNVELLQLIVRATESRVATGGSKQQDVLKTSNEWETAQNDVTTQRSRLTAQLAALNALLNRNPDAPLAPPKALPPPRPLPQDDTQLLKVVALNNPELQAQLRETVAKRESIVRAKQEYLPEFGINAGTDLSGTVQSLAGSIMLPYLRYEAINAGINQAKAALFAAEALRRQTAYDLASQVVANVTTLRDAERQADFYEQKILPRATQIVTITQNGYAVGQATLLDLLDAQRSLIAIRRMIAELRTMREKQWEDLESLGRGIDFSSDQQKDKSKN